MSNYAKLYQGAKDYAGDFFEKKLVRIPVSKISGWAAGAAGTAGAAGVMFGDGETVGGKVWNSITAVPNLFDNFRHYFHPEHYEQFVKTMETAKYASPLAREAAEKLKEANEVISKAQQASEYFDQAKNYFLDWHPIKAYDAFAKGWDMMPDFETLQKVTAEAGDGMGLAAQYLSKVDLNPVYQAFYNFADNFSGDEIKQTAAVGAASLAAGFLAAKYLGAFWGRRGRPNIVSRYVQRRGLRHFRRHYERHPEEIAGKDGVEIMKDYFSKNPDKLDLDSVAAYLKEHPEALKGDSHE